MKNDLIHQASEFDCGPTSVTNAIRFLFHREEVAPALIKHIWAMGNDTFSDAGELGKHGTSKASMRYMADWFNCYAKGHKFPLAAKFLEERDAVLEPGGPAWQCLERGGCAVARCSSGGIGHYVLHTALLPENEVGLFDPYDEEPVFTEPGRRVVHGQPKVMNRAVRADLINRTDKSDYAMGAYDTREILLLWRTDDKEDETKTEGKAGEAHE